MFTQRETQFIFPTQIAAAFLPDSLRRLRATQTLQKMTAFYEVDCFFPPKSDFFFIFLHLSVFNSAQKMIKHYILAQGPEHIGSQAVR